MRIVKTDAEGVLRVMAVAGTHVVTFGWDMAEDYITTGKVLGFGIQRTRHSDGEVIWLSGLKTFEATEPYPDPGVPVSSFSHPFQTFQWADFAVRPGQHYTYRVVARVGTPAALANGPSVELEVTTARVDLGEHAVFFNRGSVASQEYARRFRNKQPSEVGQPAYDWLSRGLVESLEELIAQAGATDELCAAFFEFKNARIYSALESAVARGVTVKILYDGDSQREANELALQGRAIAAYTKARERSGGYAHNKFIVLVKSGAPAEVWTGSTNLSENGIYGHSNNAHLVRDPAIAAKYLAYWKILDEDKTKQPTATKAVAESPAPPPGYEAISPVFSPRTDLAALDWYAALAGGAKRALFGTFAFGMNQRFVDVYDQEDDVLRFALMEKKGNGRTYRAQAEEIDRIRKLPNTVVAVGNKVELNNFDRWLQEIDRIVDEAHVLYVHTKYMLIDPLGDEPTVIVGSANFSVASTDSNDENMLVIRNNKDVADIYFGEFMRLFNHYAFRESLSFEPQPVGEPPLKYLVPDTTWTAGKGASYYKPGSERALRRAYFSGQ